MCVLKSVNNPIKRTVASESNKKPINFTRKLYERVSKICSWWYPKFTPSGYIWKPKSGKENVNPNLIEIFLFIVDSGCSKHMTRNLKLLINFVEKFLGTVKFGNDQIAPILGYGDLVQGAVTITRVYYIEGLNHNLFSIGQFCDADLEVAFRKSTCFIRALKGNDLLTGLQAQVRVVRSDKGSEFLNQTLHAYFAAEGINHQTSVARTPEQNGVILKSSTVSAADAPNQRQQYTTPLNNLTTPVPTYQIPTLAPTVLSSENINQAELNAENDQVANDEFINIFLTPDLLFSLMFDELLNGSTKVVSKSSDVSATDAPNQRQQPTTPLNNHTTPAPTCTTTNELDLLFSLMFDELLNRSSKVVPKSSAVSAADAPTQRQQLTTPLNNHTTPAPTCTPADSKPKPGSTNHSSRSLPMSKSSCTSINVLKEQSLDVSAGILWNVNKNNLRVWLLQKLISQKPLSK
nr:integrase, catalytic region, zinc finger, CCHC-type, peptidase aspartic, catalytic [Tanacetum cinerariifolium]